MVSGMSLRGVEVSGPGPDDPSIPTAPKMIFMRVALMAKSSSPIPNTHWFATLTTSARCARSILVGPSHRASQLADSRKLGKQIFLPKKAIRVLTNLCFLPPLVPRESRKLD